VLDSYALTSYVLQGWETKIKATSESDFADVEIFLKDLQYHGRKRDYVASFFDRLGGLSVGPIRTFVSGSCSLGDLDEVIQSFFDHPRGTSSWRQYFDEL
jgi:hypothetical protein